MCYDLILGKFIRVPLKNWQINPFVTVRLSPILTLENITDKKILTKDITDIVSQIYFMLHDIIVERQQAVLKHRSKKSK